VRSDIWALGVILFELACGHPPFTASTITELALRVAMDPTPGLTVPGMARGFEQVVYRCLEKDPARRFADVAQLAAALAPFGPAVTRGRAQGVARVLSARPVSVPGAPSSAGPSAPTTLGSSAVSIERAPAARSLRGALLAAVVVGGIAAAAVVTLRGKDRPSELSQEPRAEAPTLPAASPPSAAVAERPAAAAGSAAGAAAATVVPPPAPAAASSPPAAAAAVAPAMSAPITESPHEAAMTDAGIIVDAAANGGHDVGTAPATNADAPRRGGATSPTPATDAAAHPTRPSPVRRVTKPAAPPRKGSDEDDVGNSRL